jgi:hypothetical protein
MSTYETSIPGASVYGGAALLANTAYQKSLARLNQQRGDTIQQGGFGAEIDPTTGMVKGLHVDPYSKTGAFQMLNRDQAQQDEASRWQAQSRGLGTGGGLAAQMRNNTRFGFGKQDADLVGGINSALAGYTDQQTQAAQQRDSALYQAELAATQQAQQGEDWSPTDYSGLDLTPYGMNAPDATPAPVTGVKAGPAKKPAAKTATMKPIIKAMSTPAAKNALAARNAVSAAQAKATAKTILPTPKKKK